MTESDKEANGCAPVERTVRRVFYVEENMKKLISSESPQALIDAYMNNPAFHAVVTKHEIAGFDYTQMLEEAVALLANDIASRNDTLIKYARRFGPLNDA